MKIIKHTVTGADEIKFLSEWLRLCGIGYTIEPTQSEPLTIDFIIYWSVEDLKAHERDFEELFINHFRY